MRKLIAIFVALGLAYAPAMAATNIVASPGEKLVIHVPMAAHPSVVYKTHTVYRAVPVYKTHVVYKTRYRAAPQVVYNYPPAYIQRGGILTETARGIVTGGEEIGGGVYHGAVGVATGVGDVLGGLFGGLFAPRVCWNGYTQYLLLNKKRTKVPGFA